MNPGPVKVFFRLLRVKQWTKNAVVLSAFVFALGDPAQGLSAWMFWKVLLAALAFCFVSSAVYIMNDWRDRAQDALHPTKKFRPIAAGQVGGATALATALALLAAGLFGAWRLRAEPPLLLATIGGYVLLQIAYTFWLKRIPLVDVMVIAMGFVLRAVAGSVAVAVDISPWLILCAMWLALFLGLCKRRHEKLNLAGTGTRPAIDAYSAKLLDILIALTAGTVLTTYSIYTLWPDTVAKFGTHWLGVTIPFVVFGIFRYLDLVYRMDRGDRPEQILLTDIPLIIDVVLFGASALCVFFWPF